jgi:hypothetical protein
MSLLALLFAHLLADYPLQGDFLAKMKGERVLLMASHCGIWTGCIVTAAHLVGLAISPLMLVSLFVIHFAADTAKAKKWAFYAHMEPLGDALWIDQTIHFLQILVVVACR